MDRVDAMTEEHTTGAYLVIQAGAVGKRVELWKDVTTIGRSRECDIFLADIAVHRKQARIIWTIAGYVLRDDNGSNDSFVNGRPIQEVLLNNGDELTFGNSKITFNASEGTRPFQLPVSRGRESHIGQLPDTQPPIIARLELVSGRSAVRSIELFATMTIGRSRDCDIFLEDLAVSRLHATISELPDGEFELVDNKSATGTHINGQPMKRSILHDGDMVQIGANAFKFLTTPAP
jgi:pSer/pThr/pTyr-binding forkhead associated (FHA) protein